MDNTDYVIWKPEREGHAPPFWRYGMRREFRSFHSVLRDNWYCISEINPYWFEWDEYRVPAEAVYELPIDDSRNDAEFDVQTWLAQGLANADKLPDGVVLPEPTDWADTSAAEIFAMYVNVSAGVINAEVADLLRTHCQPREVSNSPDLLDVANKAFNFLGGVDDAAEIRAELMAAIVKATKP